MNCFNHQNVEAVTSCKKCGRGLCVDCIDSTHKICYECNQLEHNFSKNTLIKRIIPWFIISTVIFIILFTSLQQENISVGVYIFISYVVFCLPWIFFSTKDARLRGTIMNVASTNKIGLDTNDAIRAGNSIWILFKSMFVGIFLVPYNVIKTLIIFFKTNSIIKKRGRAN